jgi:hypothetical protein
MKNNCNYFTSTSSRKDMVWFWFAAFAIAGIHGVADTVERTTKISSSRSQSHASILIHSCWID